MELKKVCPDSCPGPKTKITIAYCISINYGYLRRDDWTRTSGLHVPNVARYQLRYISIADANVIK